ncbi:MAG: cytochrome P450 [Micromonosporaceae bacterium]
MATATLPRGPSVPRFVQGGYALAVPQRGMRQMRDRYGSAFTVNIPIFGHALVISDPTEVKQLFQAGSEVSDYPDRNLGRVLGPGSMFALRGDEHRKQRKLLVPPFHGRRLAAYEGIVEEETARELASWPQGREFPTLPSWNRITLNVILRAVFGAEGEELSQLRALLPRLVTLGSRLALLPVPPLRRVPWSPWRRLEALRREYDAIIERLIAKAEQSDLSQRDDIFALMLQARYDDGSPMTHRAIADQLATLLTAGHETTATTLAWAVERLRRHPAVLAELVAEAESGGTALREATIVEVMRSRPVIDFISRQVRADSVQIGRWVLPRGQVVIASIALMHDNDDLFPRAREFDPGRFLDAKPDLYQWIPFGGGTRRCLGGAFATMEMHVALGAMLRQVTLSPTTAPDEKWHFRGVANAPARGGRALAWRRVRQTAQSTQSAGARS